MNSLNFYKSFNPLLFLLLLLPERFPSFEILYDEAHNISSQDFIYIFSLILYFSCVLRISEFFQKCCRSLDTKSQELVGKFLLSLKQVQESKVDIDKESVSAAIREAVPPAISFRFMASSPMKTPDKVTQTPNRSFEKTKELLRVKGMLENERYERGVLESEMKQNEEQIKILGKHQLKPACGCD